MEEKTLKILPTCIRCNFGLNIELDSLCGRAYVLDLNYKSSAEKLCSSIKATWKAIWISYIVEIAGHRIFSKSKPTTSLAKIGDEGVDKFHITFVIEPTLTTKQQRQNANELALFDPHTK